MAFVQILDSKTLNSSVAGENPPASTELRPTHVAFGKTVAIPDHILSSRQQQVRMSSHDLTVIMFTSTLGYQHQVSSCDGESSDKAEPITVVHPRPPSSPAEQPLVRIRRTRVSEKSTRKSRVQVSQSSMTKDTTPNIPTASFSEWKSAGRDKGLHSDEKLAETVQKAFPHHLNTEHIDPEATSEEQVYSYRSAPKSAERHLISLPVSYLAANLLK